MKEGEAKMLIKITPNLVVDDIDTTLDYYMNLIGFFELIHIDSENGKIDWALMACEDAEIMFQSRKSISPSIPEFNNEKIVEAAVIYIEMDHLKELYKRIKDKVTVIKKLHTTPYGIQEFIIKDCNGFILVFAEL